MKYYLLRYFEITSFLNIFDFLYMLWYFLRRYKYNWLYFILAYEITELAYHLKIDELSFLPLKLFSTYSWIRIFADSQMVNRLQFIVM